MSIAFRADLGLGAPAVMLLVGAAGAWLATFALPRDMGQCRNRRLTCENGLRKAALCSNTSTGTNWLTSA